MCIYIYIYIHTHIHIYVYIYIYNEVLSSLLLSLLLLLGREREDAHGARAEGRGGAKTAGGGAQQVPRREGPDGEPAHEAIITVVVIIRYYY